MSQISQWISQHPYQSAAWAYGLLMLLLAFLLWKRGSMREKAGYQKDHGDDTPDPVLGLVALMRAGLVRRLTMRPRYVPKVYDPKRSELMAAQILADQDYAQETAGRVSHAPAPGERHYIAPGHTLRVTVADWTVCAQRNGPVMVHEQRPGVTVPPYPLPDEWGEVLGCFAFEIAKLRANQCVRHEA